jgi:hypothetical protein
MILTSVASVAVAAATISPAGATSRTFDNAYHRARSSPIVYVKPGAYPPQQMTGTGHKTVFVPLGRVSVGQTELDGVSRVEFRRMRIAGWTVDDADHVAFRNVKTIGDFFINAPSSWISVIGGAVGPSHNHNSYIAVPDDSITTPSRHILIDGVHFHDVSRDPDQHVECLMLAQGVGVTIRNSTFTRCSVFDIFVTWWEFRPAVGPPTRVRIEHNRFGHTTDGYFSLHWADVVGTNHRTWTAYTIRNNVCGQKADFASAVPRARFVVRRNRGC